MQIVKKIPKISPGSVSLYQLYALALLTLIYTCHATDRGIVSVVIEPIKHEFSASDRAMGFVSFAFSVAFIAAVVPIGAVIDRFPRVRLLGVLLGIWSLLTATAGFAPSIGFLVAARMGVGAAEAGAQPIALSLLSDVFPQHRRASALGVFYLATGFGSIIAFLGGGLIAASYGWRATFFLAGVPGLIVVPILLSTMREPLRGSLEGIAAKPTLEAKPSIIDAVRFAVSSIAVRNLLLGSLVSSSVMASFIAWAAADLMRSYQLDIKEAGMGAAFAGGLMPALGAVVSGFAADRLGRIRAERVGFMCAVSSAAMAVTGELFALAGGAPAAVVWLTLFGLLSGGWLAPSLALLIGLTPPKMRGATLALNQTFTALGAGLGPFAVGSLSDLFHHLPSALACWALWGLGGIYLYFSSVRAAKGMMVSH